MRDPTPPAAVRAPPSPQEPAHSALTPQAAAQVAALFFFVGAVANASSIFLPMPEGQDDAGMVAVSVAAAMIGLFAWHAPWGQWPRYVMSLALVPAALVLIAAANHFGALEPYTFGVAFPLVFAWIGLTQPRFQSILWAVPAALAYPLPLVVAGRPAGDLLTVLVVIPVAVVLGETCSWVSLRLRAAEAGLRSAGAGLERFLGATITLGAANTESEAASLTAGSVLDLLGADRAVVMLAEDEGSSCFVSRGQRNIGVPLGGCVADVSTNNAVGWAVRTGRTVFIPDLAASAVAAGGSIELAPSASAAFIPIPGEGGHLGVAAALWDTPREGLDAFAQRAAEVLSGQAGRVLERVRATARLTLELGVQGRTVALLEQERTLLGVLQAVTVAANRARSLEEALQSALDEICAYSGWPVGHAYVSDGKSGLVPSGAWHLRDDSWAFGSFREMTERTPLSLGSGLPGRVALTGEAVWVPDLTADPEFSRRPAAEAAGLRAGFGVPVPLDGVVVAVLEFFTPRPLPPDDSLIELALHVGTQLARAAERQQAQTILQASEERLRSVLDTAGDAFVEIDDADRVMEWNQQAAVLFGWSRPEALGQQLADLIIPADLRSAHRAALRRYVATGERAVIGRPLEVRARARDGREFPVELMVWSTQQGSRFRFAAFVRDISERKQLQAELTRQALHDPLTSLPNRTLFVDRLGHALARGDRHRTPVVVLFLDLDGFKTINDSLGHASGDRLLVAIAERLNDCLRGSDTVSRFGGDEFAILAEEATPEVGAVLAQRVLDDLGGPFMIEDHPVWASASIGVATGEGGQHTAEDVLRNADLAMYMAKGKGKGRFVVFETGMHAAAMQRLEMEADLRRAIGRSEFLLHFQPVVRLADGSMMGTEALIRWQRDGRLVSPAQFIPIAEETGLIRDIGRWVLREACQQTVAWQRRHSRASRLELNVNLSPRELQDPLLLSVVEQALAASGLSPAALVVEITETVLMADPDLAVKRLAELRDLGVRLAVDDFGTGYSSLSYLRRFPVDILKIDRSFVAALGQGPEDAALAHAIVKLGETLNLQVVAEGVETAAQLAELRSLGCDYGQGYYFSPPLASGPLEAMLTRDAALTLPASRRE